MRIDSEYLLLNPGRKHDLIDWCNEHGVDVNQVPIDALVLFPDENVVEIEVWDKTTPIAPAAMEIPRRFHRVEFTRPFPLNVLTA